MWQSKDIWWYHFTYSWKQLNNFVNQLSSLVYHLHWYPVGLLISTNQIVVLLFYKDSALSIYEQVLISSVIISHFIWTFYAAFIKSI